jgi:hypothetical protein
MVTKMRRGMLGKLSDLAVSGFQYGNRNRTFNLLTELIYTVDNLIKFCKDRKTGESVQRKVPEQ